jgi:hypothetical protein
MPKKSSKSVAKKAVKKVTAKIKENPIEVVKENFAEEVADTKISAARSNTKMSQLIEMIKNAEEGISLKQICENLKWQSHTARSAISRLNKNQNLGIINDKIVGIGRVYKLPKKD